MGPYLFLALSSRWQPKGAWRVVRPQQHPRTRGGPDLVGASTFGWGGAQHRRACCGGVPLEAAADQGECLRSGVVLLSGWPVIEPARGPARFVCHRSPTQAPGDFRCGKCTCCVDLVRVPCNRSKLVHTAPLDGGRLAAWGIAERHGRSRTRRRHVAGRGEKRGPVLRRTALRWCNCLHCGEGGGSSGRPSPSPFVSFAKFMPIPVARSRSTAVGMQHTLVLHAGVEVGASVALTVR